MHLKRKSRAKGRKWPAVRVTFRSDSSKNEATYKVSFGSVTVSHTKPTQSEFNHNIKLGAQALSKAKSKFVTSGVALKPRKGIPFYYADPERPGYVIRQLDGKTKRGSFRGSKFKSV